MDEQLITVLGWLATALVIASYAQASVARLRRLSLVASVLLIVFNTALGIWSNVALEVALVVINLIRLVTSSGEDTVRPTVTVEEGGHRGIDEFLGRSRSDLSSFVTDGA